MDWPIGWQAFMKIVINNRKAALLTTYYGVATDDDTGSKKEWSRFAKLEEIGTSDHLFVRDFF